MLKEDRNMNHKHIRMRAATPLKEHVDNLKLIRGIGPAIEEQLHQIGICTFAQLAVMSPSSIAQLLAGIGGASAQRVAKQRWIEQAREQMRDAMHTKQPSIKASHLSRQRYATFTVELLIDGDNSVRRTRVVHVQDGQEMAWADWEETRLLDFMTERAAFHIERKPWSQEASLDRAASSSVARKSSTSVATAPAPDGASPSAGTTRRPKSSSTPNQVESPPSVSGAGWLPELCIDVNALRLVEVPAASPTQTHLHAEMDFQLVGNAAEKVTALSPYCTAQVLACEMPDGRTTTLAVERQRLASRQLAYKMTLGFELPEVGRYQLFGTVLLPDGDVAGVAVGPILTVVP